MKSVTITLTRLIITRRDGQVTSVYKKKNSKLRLVARLPIINHREYILHPYKNMAHFRTVPYQFLTMAHQHKPPTRPHNFPRLLASRHWSKQKFPLKKKDSYRKNYKKQAPALTLTHQNLSLVELQSTIFCSKYHRLGIRRLFDSLNF